MNAKVLLYCWVLLATMPILNTHAEDATVTVRVVDNQNRPIAGVELKVFLWIGKWEATSVEQLTDASGLAQLKSVPAGNYLTVSARADGFASVCQDMELSKNENRKINLTLVEPVHGTIRVLDEHGTPIEGAVLSELSFAASSGGALFHRHGTNDPFEFEPSASDQRGEIRLPAIPRGAKVSLSVFHPNYIVSEAENLVASESRLVDVRMQKGIPLQIEFVSVDDTELPRNRQILFYLSPNESDRGRIKSIYHRMSWQGKNNLSLSVAAANYSSLRISTDEDFTITPTIEDDDEAFKQLLKVNEGGGVHQIQMLVRRNVKISGKIEGDLSFVSHDSEVIGWTENLHPNLPKNTGLDRWYPASFANIGKDGSFELSLPPGNSRVTFRGLGASITEPSELEFVVDSNSDQTIPTAKVRKLPKLKGVVEDSEGKPMANSFVRLQVGVWGSDYVRSDAQGQFEVEPDLIIETSHHSKAKLPLSMIAIDPKSGRCGRLSLAEDWQSGLSLRVVCDRDAQWLVEQIESQLHESRNTMGRKSSSEAQDSRRVTYADGEVGRMTPDLSDGKWLNSTASSLKEFRGKYVLLDFWFIGCGPCARDLPTVKLAQETFGGDRFAVVSVHVTSQTPENVAQYAKEKGMTYPIVVDNDDGTIQKSFQSLGVRGFPSYILLDPEGKILHNDQLSDGPSLRVYKLETLLRNLGSK